MDERRQMGGEQSLGGLRNGLIKKKSIFTNYNSVTDIHNPSPFSLVEKQTRVERPAT